MACNCARGEGRVQLVHLRQVVMVQIARGELEEELLTGTERHAYPTPSIGSAMRSGSTRVDSSSRARGWPRSDAAASVRA